MTVGKIEIRFHPSSIMRGTLCEIYDNTDFYIFTETHLEFLSFTLVFLLSTMYIMLHTLPYS